VNPEQDRSDQTDRRPRFCLVNLPTGTGHPFCGIKCLVNWIKFVKGDVEGAELGYARDRNCSYCYLCGRRCGESPHCWIHDGDCPERDYLYTYGMVKVTEVVYGILGEQLDDDDFDTVVKVYSERGDGEDSWSVGSRAADAVHMRREGRGK